MSTAPDGRLQISLSAKDLPNIAGFLSKSDPFAVATIRGDDPNNRPIIAGQTEVAFNNLNPTWATVIIVEGYKFGLPFYIEVGVFDFTAAQVGKDEKKLAQQSSDEARQVTTSDSTRALLKAGKLPYHLIGTALFEFGIILGQRGNMASKQLQNGAGVVYVHVEKSRDDGAKGTMRLQLRGLHLTNVQTLGRKSSPFFELHRKVDRPTGAIWACVYRSNVVRSDLQPTWDEAKLSIEAVCNGNLDRAMKVVVYDHRRSSGKHKIIGEFETTMAGFLHVKESGGDVDEDKAFRLRKKDKRTGNILVLQASIVGDSNSSSSGQLDKREAPQSSLVQSSSTEEEEVISASSTVSSLTMTRAVKSQELKPERPSFIDYLSGGCQVSLAVAIDFTASNGNPMEKGTPHYFYPPSSKEWNDYQKAIYAVGTVLAKYDNDQLMPVWGFGAKYNNQVRHCFQVGNDVEVQGVEGIMKAYKGVFSTTLTMSYPTVFTDVIRTAARYANHEHDAAQEEGKLSYTILLILTAGNVQDANKTKNELIAASFSPLSVVIVGIGNQDFGAMEFLDEHDPAKEGGRDITKFVKFNDYTSFNKLTEAVLDEIPDQLVSFYFDKGILPGQAEEIAHDDVEVMPADDDERTVNFLG